MPDGRKKNGGARKGAGRPKSDATFRTQEMRRRVLDFLDRDNNFEKILEAMMLKALSGDVKAAKELFDRGFGKAPQQITGDPDNPIEVAHNLSTKSSKLLKDLKKHEESTETKNVAGNAKASPAKGASNVGKGVTPVKG